MFGGLLIHVCLFLHFYKSKMISLCISTCILVLFLCIFAVLSLFSSVFLCLYVSEGGGKLPVA